MAEPAPAPFSPGRTLDATAAPDGPPVPTAPDPSSPSHPALPGCRQFPFLIADRYLVEGELGHGGMARVFLARDRRLQRPVAIKVVAGHGSRTEMERLEQEARVVASLGHANILQVHDVGQFEEGPYVVEEYLEGRTLRQLLRAGLPTVAEALDLAAQAARGLAAAHERGVVHCDLKPENLLVTAERQLKILDFGIARLSRLPVREDGQEGPAPDGTAPGGFAGTPAYSSPEQVRCAPFDHRSDLFSLGVVLYELLSGRRPFPARDFMEVAFEVLRSPVPPLPKGVPADVQRIVARCLEKDPENRFRSARELEAALVAVADRIRAKIWPRRIAITFLALLVATVPVLLWARLRSDEPISYRQITFLPGAIWTARFAPDGKTIFYTEAFDGLPPRIFSTRIGSPEHHRPEMNDAVLLAVSRGGDLALLRNPVHRGAGFSGTLAVLPQPGGAPRDILDAVDDADFWPDGTLVLVRGAADGSRLESPIGTALFRTPGWIGDVRVSRDGQRVAFTHHPEINWYRGDVEVVDRSGGAVSLAGPWGSVSGVSWSPDGGEVWFAATGGRATPGGTPLSLRAVSLRGRQRELARAAGHLEVLDVSPDGRVVAIQPRRILGIAVARAGRSLDLSVQDEQILHDVAADGSRILFTTNPRAGEGAIHVRGTDGADPVKIADGYGGALAPDGDHALIFPMPGSGKPLSLISIGAGHVRALRSNGLMIYRGRYAGTGEAILTANEPGRPVRLWLLSLADEQVRPLSEEGIGPAHVAIARDAAAAVDPHGVLKIYPFDGGAPREVAGTRAGEAPYAFLGDGGLLVGRDAEGTLELDRLDVETNRRTHWRTLRPITPGASIGRVLLSGKEDVIAYSQESTKTHLYLLEGVK